MNSFNVDEAWKKGTEIVIHGENGNDISIKDGINFVKNKADEYEKALEEKRVEKTVGPKTAEERS